MATLLLRLAAPLQSWGSSSKFNIRTTEREPTKSGVIGMLAAALGIQRNSSPEELEPLKKLKFGVGVEREGKLLKDFHMAFAKNISDKERRKTPPEKLKNFIHASERYYLSDAVFVAGLESDDREYLEQLAYAIQNPVYPLFLGRRSCPPTLPIFLEIRDECLDDALKGCGRKFKRIVLETEIDGIMVQDNPISFSQLHRQYGYRMVKEEIIKNTDEHDPMAEL